MLVLFMCIASQDLIPNADSEIKIYQFPFCFLSLSCPINRPCSQLCGVLLTEKQEGENKICKFFQSDINNEKTGIAAVKRPAKVQIKLSGYAIKLLYSPESILHQLLFTRHEP